MQICFHGFGGARIIKDYKLEIANNTSISQIKKTLIKELQKDSRYNELNQIIHSCALANEEHVFDENEIIDKDIIISLLPPVCGG